MLAIAGGKGGTGKTTTALGLATALGAPREGRARATGCVGGDVLVVDADVDVPDLHAMAGVAREPTVLEDPDGLPVAGWPGVRVAPAPPPDATSAFRTRLRELSSPRERRTGDGRSRRRVLVDAPCGAGPDAALPMAVADAVLLVTRPTTAAVRDTAKTAAMARALDTPIAAVAVVGSTPDRSTATGRSAPNGSTVSGPSTPNGSTVSAPSTPSRSLAEVFDVDDVVRVPSVDGDPLADAAHAGSMRRLTRTSTAGQSPF